MLFPIYYEREHPPVSGVAENVIEKEVYMTDFQRFGREDILRHQMVDDSPWYLPYPGKWICGFVHGLFTKHYK